MSTFYMPVPVFEEQDAVRNHAADFKQFGNKALIVTGRSSAKKNGAYDDVTAALDSNGISHVLFDEVEENPSIETIMKARDLGVREQVEFVVGIGGGSPLDAAKAISLMIRHADKDVSYLYSPDGGSEALPVAAVPTTCGTGSEVTPVSVLTNTPKGIKKSIPHKLFPQLALIDGKYLRSAPERVIACTAFDALTHLVESELNSKMTPYSHMCTDAGLKTWALSLPVLRGEKTPGDEDYMNMMRASMMAGMSIAHTSTTLPHGLSYPLTYKLGVPHGKATAYFTAGYLDEAPAERREYLLHTAGFSSLEDFRSVFRRTCGPVEVEEAALISVLNDAVAETASNPVKMALAAFKVNKAVLERIAFYELSDPLSD